MSYPIQMKTWWIIAGMALAGVAHGVEAEVRMHHGRPTAFVDGEPLAFAAYSPIMHVETMKRQTARFFVHGMGAYLITPPMARAEGWGATPFWTGDEITGEVVATPSGDIDELAWHVLEGDPNAYILLRDTDGCREPQSWRELHPEELFVNDEGGIMPVPSMASDRFIEMRSRCIAAAIGYYEGRPWSDRIIGYWNGDRGEGTHEPLCDGWMFDHSPVMLEKWRAFLKEKYGTVEALREAHGVTDADFDTYDTPRDANRGAIKDAEQRPYWPSEAAVRDYLELNRDLYHKRFTALAKATQEACGDKKRILVYDCLKQWMQGWSNYGFFNRRMSWPVAFPDIQAGSGHISVAPLLLVEGFSGLITPHDYQARGIGGVYENEGIADSCVLRGKIFFSEMDTRSYTANDPIFAARDLHEFSAITWRNLATAWSRGFHNYWMDVSQDWFADEAMHETVIAPQIRAIKQSLDWKHEDEPCIAVIIDDSAALDSDIRGNYLNEAVLWEVRQGLARCGVPHRIYLLDDLALDNFPPHKVYYFPNLFKGDERKMALLKDKVFRDGNVVVWGPASGVCGGAAGAEALTGFTMEFLRQNLQRRALVSNFDHPLTRTLDAATFLGGAFPYGPVLLPVDGDRLAEAWIQYGLVRAALAAKEIETPEGETWKSVFTIALGLPANFWREAARWSGTHVWSEDNDVLVASRAIVGIHTLRPGRRTVTLPYPATVTDVITDTTIATNATTISWDAPAHPDTRVFRICPTAKDGRL
ncbi:MAG: hypothetical protein FWF84_01475 [Kiritimatiellaeota bacterium]|nr:hypothetical protein [Kiritimatiellota bacterium]